MTAMPRSSSPWGRVDSRMQPRPIMTTKSRPGLGRPWSELAALHFLEEMIAIDVLRIVFRLGRKGVVVVLAGSALRQLFGAFGVLPNQLCELFLVHEAAGKELR